jgi:hypothetical protein
MMMVQTVTLRVVVTANIHYLRSCGDNKIIHMTASWRINAIELVTYQSMRNLLKDGIPQHGAFISVCNGTTTRT